MPSFQTTLSIGIGLATSLYCTRKCHKTPIKTTSRRHNRHTSSAQKKPHNKIAPSSPVSSTELDKMPLSIRTLPNDLRQTLEHELSKLNPSTQTTSYIKTK